MMAIGQMAKGSSCSVCHKDLSGIKGVQVNTDDFCFDCFEQNKNNNIHNAVKG